MPATEFPRKATSIFSGIRIGRPLASIIAASLLINCGGKHTMPAPAASATPTNDAVATCPQSGAVPAAAVQGVSGSDRASRRIMTPLESLSTTLDTVVVSYSRASMPNGFSSVIAAANARFVNELDLNALSLQIRTVGVNPANERDLLRQLNRLPGVISAQPLQYRALLAASPNDPYYKGTGIAPYFQSASGNGQWDMHVINLDGAWARFPGSSVIGTKIAIIDTGADVSQTELAAGKVVLTKCFVTFPAGSTQTTGTFVTDTDGHGTNVAGIASADTNNNVGFAGVGWNAPLMIYKIFPATPKGGCESSTSVQCSATDVDEVSAINDAVANGASVINLSLGLPPPCNDSLEQTAISRALAAGVVVVAAAGNERAANLDCPAAYPGVIAVGATSLNDSTATFKEYVASYSNFLTTNGGGTYVVAPGGDPASGADPDNLHWIMNIYSGNAADLTTTCGTNCAVFIAGTSQAGPHVAGVISLMRAINPRLSPSQLAQDLCMSADNISDPKQGCGRVNAGAAVALAASQ